MIRSELVKALANESGYLSVEEGKRVANGFFDQIARCLAESGRVRLRVFGIFSTHWRNPRCVRNPWTGQEVDVPAKRVTYFKASKEIRVLLNAG